MLYNGYELPLGISITAHAPYRASEVISAFQKTLAEA